MTADQKRVRITRILVLVFLMISILMCIFGVQFEKAILPAAHTTNIAFLDQHRFVIILILGYCCAAALLIMQVTMYRFLKRIETGMYCSLPFQSPGICRPYRHSWPHLTHLLMQ